MRGIVDQLKDGAPKRVHINVTPPDGNVLIDRHLIGIAIGNLLNNALRYSEPDTSVELSALCEKDKLSVTVRDHGPGVSLAELANLGTPYYRANSSVGKSGTGLGFYFCHRIVEAHGGTLTARNIEEGGLETCIELPGAAARLVTSSGASPAVSH